MNKKEINVPEIVNQILKCSNSDELCERFNAAYSCRDEDDEFVFENLGYNLMRAIALNSVNSAFYAFCGASSEEILKKGLFIPDERRRFYDEYEDIEVRILFEDGSESEVSCQLCTDTHELLDFEFTPKDKKKQIKRITYEFCDLECEVYPKSDMYDDDKWSFWYDDLKWRKEE